MTNSQVLEVPRDRPLAETRVVDEELREPGAGEVLFAVERFGLASNNVSYALLGDLLGHWEPFPAAEPGWGRVPAWGLVKVLAADSSVATVGSRYLGYVPMGTHMIAQVLRTPTGLQDVSVERRTMLPFYRHLVRVDDDPQWSETLADAEVVMLPVHPPAALLDEYLSRAPIAAVVLSSATSKTALATARLLRERNVEVTGLTSPRGLDAAAEADAYDSVLAYGEVDTLPRRPGTAFLDIAGRPELTASVHARLADDLVRSVGIGGSHLAQVGVAAALQTPPPRYGPPIERFSVGQREVDLHDELGPQALGALELRARRSLVRWAGSHLTIEALPGLEAAGDAWLRTAQGSTAPMSATVIALH